MSPELVKDFGSFGAQVDSVELSPDERLLAVASSHTYKVCVYDACSGVQKWSANISSPQAVFSPDGTQLAVADHRGNCVKIFASETGDLLKTSSGHTAFVNGVAWSSTGIIASSSKDQTVRLWNPENGTGLLTLCRHSSSVLCVSFSPDGTQLASCSPDGTIRICDVASSSCLHTLTADSVWRVAFARDGSKLATVFQNGTVRIRDASSNFDCIRSLAGVGIAFRSTIAWSPDSRILASANGNSLRLWDESGALVLEMPSKASAMTFSRFSHEIITGSEDGKICWWKSPVTWALDAMRFGEISPPCKSPHDVSATLERISTIIDRMELPAAFHQQIKRLHVLHDRIGGDKESNPDLAVRIEECFGNLRNHQQILCESQESLQIKARQHLPVSEAKDDLVALDSSMQRISHAIPLLEKQLQEHAAISSSSSSPSSKRNDHPSARKPSQDELNDILRFASVSNRKLFWLENMVIDTASKFESALLQYDQYSAEIREQAEKNLGTLESFLWYLTQSSISPERVREIESALSKLQAKLDSENKIMAELDRSLSALSATSKMNRMLQDDEGKEQKAKAVLISGAENETLADHKTDDSGDGRQQLFSPSHPEINSTEKAKEKLKSTSGIAHNPHLIYKWLHEHPKSELDAAEVFDIIGII